jgi:hypothetical protein
MGSAAGVYLSEGRHPIIPTFQHSIIPVVSAANQVLYFYGSLMGLVSLPTSTDSISSTFVVTGLLRIL